MAHESFEDQEAAIALNQDYIAIKVDREERPDIDAVYMSVCQTLTGSGGWPLTIFMTPDQKPFYACTYLPKQARWGSPGLLDVLENIGRLWKEERDRLLKAGDEITEFLNHSGETDELDNKKPDRQLLLTGCYQLNQSFDKTWGGFSRAPKFPMGHNLLFLIRHSYYEKDSSSRSMVEKTLTQMYRGGIYDHLGGGFSRYSTDEKWLVPHFEKMLYDNALLAYTYLEVSLITKDDFYKNVAQGILSYVMNTLTDEGGGFTCGQDADSEGVEGKFYTFKEEEIRKILGDEAEEFIRWYGITKEGNFEGENILNLIENKEYKKTNETIEKGNERLFSYREKRTRLHLDDKILTSWNGLMIGAMAKASQVFSDERYERAAQRSVKFLEENLTNSEGRLFVRYRDGDAAYDGQLDDYAFYIFGLLELYDATLDPAYLEKAIQLSHFMITLFFDQKQGGFYMYAHDREALISRPKECYDGALPSGNSVAAYVLSRLYHLTGEITWQEVLTKQMKYLMKEINASPANFCFSLLSLQTILYPTVEIVAVTFQDAIQKEIFQLNNLRMPGMSILLKTGENEKVLSKIAPFTKDYPIPETGTKYYVCQNGTCKSPLTGISELKKALAAFL